MIEKTFDEFFSRLDKIDFGKHDLIIAIGSGGIEPAKFIQKKLKIPMKVITVNYRDKSNQPKYEDAKLFERKEFKKKNAKILLVDDVSRTGKTLRVAKDYLKGNEIKTCLVNGKADYSFYNLEECIKMPWKK